MTTKDYLRQIYRLDRRIELDRCKIEKLRAVLDYKPPSGGSGSGSSADRIPDTLAKIMEYEEQAERLKKIYIEIYETAEQAVKAVEDPVLREVLERRYFLYQKWEEIAEEMNYTTRRVHQLHGKALQKISLNFTI
jgi:DNA-directed RNA polymerase specialized sigma24 family protein